VRTGLRVLLWPALYAIAAATGLYAAMHPSQRDVLETNKLTKDDRVRALIVLGGAVGTLLLVYGLTLLVSYLVARRRGASSTWSATAAAASTSRALSPVLAFPIVVYLAQPGIEKTSPKVTLFFAAIAAAIVGRAAYAWRRAPAAVDPDAPRGLPARALAALGRGLPLAGAIALWLAYGAYFTRLAVTNHHGLVTRTIDLGYYDNIFYQSLHGHPLGCSFIKAGNHSSAHFDPILVLLSPIYALYPRAELLLGLQSFWLGAGAIPAYLLARRLLESRLAGLALAVVYVAYPALHGANMYEFHSLSLIAPLVLWLLYFFEGGNKVGYFAALAVLLLVREDVPLLLCFVGLYALLVPRAGAARLGRYTIAISVLYFAIVKAFFMQSSGILNAGKDAYSFEYYYDAMIPDRNGIGGLVASIVTNPLFAIRHALEEPKVVFLVQIFLPLAFLPFAARWGRVMLFYGLLFCLLASRGPVFQIGFQYSAILFPVAIALVPVALRQVREGRFAAYAELDPARLSRALLVGCLTATLLVSWKFGGIVDNATFKGGFARVTRSLSDDQKALYAWVDEQATSIPEGASVGTTNRLGSHVSNRMKAYFYPSKTGVDYLFIDESELKAPELEKHKQAVDRGDFVQISRNGKLALLKRKGL
jgi:uncharacterized membrane protein